MGDQLIGIQKGYNGVGVKQTHLELDEVPNLESIEVLGHFPPGRVLGILTLEVNLDQEVELPEVIVRADRGVGVRC